MKESEDAHGRLMYDFLKGKETFEIVERDDGYFQALPASGYFSDYRNWSTRHKNAMKYVKGRVLDIGCGAGRHSLYLQRRGFNVLGIDISPNAIKTSRLRGLKNAKVMSITQVGAKLGIFDTLLMMGGNFGLFANPKKAGLLLRRFYKMTSPAARIVAEVRDPYKTKDPLHLDYHRFNRKRGRMSGQLRIRVRYKKHATPWFDYLLVSKEEMKGMLKATGWRIRRIIGASTPLYVAIIEKDSEQSPP